jgi:hypothetical protein
MLSLCPPRLVIFSVDRSNLRRVYRQFRISEVTTYSLPDRSIQTTTIRPRCIRRECTCQYGRPMIKLGFHFALPDATLANVVEPYCLQDISVGSAKKKRKKYNQQYPMKIVRVGRGLLANNGWRKCYRKAARALLYNLLHLQGIQQLICRQKT